MAVHRRSSPALRLFLPVAAAAGAWLSLAAGAGPGEPPSKGAVSSAAAKTGERPWVMLAEISGSINPGSGAHLIEAIHEAEESGAQALVVRLDTPGGLLATTRDIVQVQLSSKVPVIVWVGPPGARAGSAGVFLTLAANIAAMAPSTNIGAAHPVGIGTGGGQKSEKDGKQDEKAAGDDGVMAQKVENDTAAFVTGIAERRSRNVEWAESAVRDSVSITSSKALELKVIDLLAEDLPELLQKVDGRKVALSAQDTRELRTLGAEVRTAGWSVKNRVLNFLADPEIAWLIAMLGVLGIMAELYHPGSIAPGVVGVICLLIAGVAFQMIPVSAGALALLVLGVVLIGAELYVGGQGALIVAGGVCLVIGSLLLVGHVGQGMWADRDYGIGWRLVAPVGLAICVIAYTLVSNIAKTSKRRLSMGPQAMVGLVGEVSEEFLSGKGQVMVNGELWNARSASALKPGAKAKVVSIEGLVVQVEPDDGSAAPLV